MDQVKGIGIVPLVLGTWFAGTTGAQLLSQITSSAPLFTRQVFTSALVFISSLCMIAIGIGILLEWGAFAPSEGESQKALLAFGAIALIVFGAGFYL